MVESIDWKKAGEIALKSKLTEKGVEELAAVVDTEVAEHFKVRKSKP